MRQTITGLYLNHFSYSESSIILKLFTKEHGLCSFVVRGGKKRKGGGVYQPFHQLEITSNYNPEKDMNLALGVRLYNPPKSLTLDVRKSTVAIFLTEVLYKSIREEEKNVELYSFLISMIQQMDEDDFSPDFHLLFLVKLSRYFGFLPSLPELPSMKYFNTLEGVFEFPSKLTSDHLDERKSLLFKKLLEVEKTGSNNLEINNKERSDLIDSIVRYYTKQLHLKEGYLKSHNILKTVFMD